MTAVLIWEKNTICSIDITKGLYYKIILIKFQGHALIFYKSDHLLVSNLQKCVLKNKDVQKKIDFNLNRKTINSLY